MLRVGLTVDLQLKDLFCFYQRLDGLRKLS